MIDEKKTKGRDQEFTGLILVATSDGETHEFTDYQTARGFAHDYVNKYWCKDDCLRTTFYEHGLIKKMWLGTGWPVEDTLIECCFTYHEGARDDD